MRSCKLLRFRARTSFNMCLVFWAGNRGLRIFRTADVGQVCVVSRNRHCPELRAALLRFVQFTAFSATIICGNIPKKPYGIYGITPGMRLCSRPRQIFLAGHRGKLFSRTLYVGAKCYAVQKCTPATSRRNRSNLSPRRGHLISERGS